MGRKSCPVRGVARGFLRMGYLMQDHCTELADVVNRAVAGDDVALEEVFIRRRDPLRRMVQFRMDHRLQGRLDASDVLQEAFLEATRRIGDYRTDPAVPFLVWLRFLVAEQLTTHHRRHLGVQARDPGREISLYGGPMPAASSAALAAHLVGHLTSPSEAAVRVERTLRLQEALNEMDEVDREVLALRHFEQLSRSETAEVLGISEGAAGKRYLRALQRLKGILVERGDSGPGGDRG